MSRTDVHVAFGQTCAEGRTISRAAYKSYGTSMRLLDFADAEPSRTAINQWVSDATTPRSPSCCRRARSTPAPPRCWSTPSTSRRRGPPGSSRSTVNEAGTFTRLDDSVATTAMMFGRQDAARYIAGEGYEAAELPLRGEALTMVIIVPEAGTFAQFTAALDGPALGQIFDALAPTSLDVTMPRFTFSSDLALKKPLEALGMVASFELGSGDFSGMSPAGGNWAIADVYHSTFIGVDEKGVEAAAATAVVVLDSGDPGAETSLTADRPLLFAIRDRGTDSLLFFGQVVDPSK